MSKKDYIQMAKILREFRQNHNVSVEAFKVLTNNVCDMFQRDNPSFDKDRFLEAVYKEV